MPSPTGRSALGRSACFRESTSAGALRCIETKRARALKGLVLFAHGSRDPEWARPFEQLAGVLSAKLSSDAIAIAYLELMQPTLSESIGALAAKGCDLITVVPVFL